MGLGKLISRRAPEQVETRNAGAGFQVIIDGNPVNSPMQAYRGGMSIPGAWRAALIIADLLGSMPWSAYRSRPGRPLEKVEPTPLLLEQPSPPDTRMTTISSLVLDLVWHGNAIEIVAARNRDGWPTATLPVSADSVGVRRVPPGEYSPLPVGAIEYKIGDRSFGADEVIHTKGPCQPGALRGFGVLEAHMETLDLAHEQRRQASTLSRHGVPTGTLKSENPDLTQQEADDLKAKWLQSQRERSIAVLNATTDFQPLSWNPEELQLIDARKFTLHEMALIFGLPLSFLGADQNSRTYTNIEQEDIQLLKYGSVGGHVARFEQTRSLALPRGTEAKANLDAVLRADTLARYQAHAIALDKGFLTVNEVRALEDRPPLPPTQRPDEEGTNP